MPRARQVCSVAGCPELAPCRIHRLSRHSSRNHHGVPRQDRGHGAAYDRQARELVGRPCALQYPGCTGVATGGDYTRPGDWTSPLQPACAHCQSVQGGRLSIAKIRRVA